MIALRVFGEGQRWFAEVSAIKEAGSAEWVEIPDPIRVEDKWPTWALQRAIDAHDKRIRMQRRESKEGFIECLKCGHEWKPRGAPPQRCPNCFRDWRTPYARSTWRGRPPGTRAKERQKVDDEGGEQ